MNPCDQNQVENPRLLHCRKIQSRILADKWPFQGKQGVSESARDYARLMRFPWPLYIFTLAFAYYRFFP